jgi:hypothetical protein
MSDEGKIAATRLTPYFSIRVHLWLIAFFFLRGLCVLCGENLFSVAPAPRELRRA